MRVFRFDKFQGGIHFLIAPETKPDRISLWQAPQGADHTQTPVKPSTKWQADISCILQISCAFSLRQNCQNWVN